MTDADDALVPDADDALVLDAADGGRVHVAAPTARWQFLLAGALWVALPAALEAYLASLEVGGSVGRGLAYNTIAFALTGLVPLFIVMQRREGAAGFGLDGPRGGVVTGLPLAIPFVVVAVSGALALGADVGRTAFGAFGFAPLLGASNAAVVVYGVITTFLARTFLFGFCAVRARTAFGGSPVALRATTTRYGIGLAVAGLALGIAANLTTDPRPLVLEFIDAAALIALIVATASLIERDVTVPRPMLLAPAALTLVQGAAGLAFPAIPVLRQAEFWVLSAGTMLAVVCLIESRRWSWAAVPVIAATAIYGVSLFNP